MKKVFIILACVLGPVLIAPQAHAGYERTIIGYDSKDRPIIRVVWVADHLDFPRTGEVQRRTYPTSGRRDIQMPTRAPSIFAKDRDGNRAYPRYSAYDSRAPYVYEE